MEGGMGEVCQDGCVAKEDTRQKGGGGGGKVALASSVAFADFTLYIYAQHTITTTTGAPLTT